MTGNPFEEGADGSAGTAAADSGWLVVVNDAGQHALWRPFLPPAPGWRTVWAGTDRDAALDFAEAHGTDPRPAGPAPAAS